MSTPIIHYFFVQSPWSFFGFNRVVEIARKHDTPIIHKPCRAADVWQHGGGVPLAQRPKPRQEYRMVEMKRWANFLNIPVNLTPAAFPVDETLAARTIIAVQDERQGPDRTDPYADGGCLASRSQYCRATGRPRCACDERIVGRIHRTCRLSGDCQNL